MEGPARPNAPPPEPPIVEIPPDGHTGSAPTRKLRSITAKIEPPKDETEWTTRWTSSPLLRGASPLTVGKPWRVRDW
jgi:hypothetical protein